MTASRLSFTKELTLQEPLPQEAQKRVLELLQSGRLHRYNTAEGEPSDVALLEEEFAAYMGARFCAAMSSCGSALYVALKSLGVRPGSKVLCNAFTLAPVPSAIENTGAQCVLVDIGSDYTVDLDDLVRKRESSGARFFLLSHMRGHVANMTEVARLCKAHGLTLIEDCAHTAGARWDGRLVGSFGSAACFSAQTYKHFNAGEGGLLVTDDDDVAARAILYSGSYMLYEHHRARPSLEVFERHKYTTPNYSLRMSALQAAMVRPQLARLDEQCRRWNTRHDLIVATLKKNPRLRLPERDPREQYVGSSVQLSISGIDPDRAERLVAEWAARGVPVSWYGRPDPVGFASRYTSWRYLGSAAELHQTDDVLNTLFDFRVPLTLSADDCRLLAAVVSQVVEDVLDDQPCNDKESAR